jgi:hypothetical protein
MTAMTKKKVRRARTMMPARYPSSSPLLLRMVGFTPPVGAGVADAMAMAAARFKIMARRKNVVFMPETIGRSRTRTKGAWATLGPDTAASYVPLMTP